VSFSVLFVCICVLYYCHRVATQLQLNISYFLNTLCGQNVDLYTLNVLVWAGHVARMGENSGVHRVLVGKPEGKRPLGRQRRR
jgi:hypothetical protein